LRIANRLKRLRPRLTEAESDALLVSQPENRYYLSGFSGSAGFLLITAQKAILATDFRYVEQAKIEAPDYELFQISNVSTGWLPGLVAELGVRRLGFESGHITFIMHQQLTDALSKARSQLELVPVEGLVESLRAIKEAEEIALITRAREIADDALRYIEDIIHPGMTEKETAWEIERFLREKGSQAVPFEIIVASGPNSALPHAKPSSRAIRPDEPIIMDIGARCNGYCSDLSRTICLGTPDDFKKVYNIVLSAQKAALTGIKEGMTGNQADSLARKVIDEAGYAQAFGHSLGHGIGLAPHEAPRLGPGSQEQLTAGMVFTIEPGIYLAGWGGVRIEDDFVIENGSARVISEAGG